MAQLKRMDQIRLIISTYLEVKTFKGTARRLGVSRNTIKDYVSKLQAHYPDLGDALLASDEVLAKRLYSRAVQGVTDREKVFNDQVDHWLKELSRVGVTRRLLWEEYRREHTDGFGYTQFCERFKKAIGRRDLTLALSHNPGEVMQVDFAGKKLRWVDAESGEVHTCEVLVGVLPHSQYTFAIALASQQVVDFVEGLNAALCYLGGTPKVMLSDNLSSYVKRADRYDPTFNDVCVQLATHYGLDLDATRVAKPKDKASVENMVSTAYRRIYAPLRNEIFHSIEALNIAIKKQLERHNNQPYQKRDGSRKSVFQTYEQSLLGSLPSTVFELKKTVLAKVQRNYHVYLGEQKNYYSVPYQYANEKATVIYTRRTVEVYVKGQRVAVHACLSHHDTNRYQTNEKHLPKNHLEWRKAQGYDAAYFIGKAQKIGPHTTWAVQQILLSRIHEPQAYKSCLGVLRLADKYSPQRLEQACNRCRNAGKTNYTMLKNILSKNLDQVNDQLDLFTPPEHDNIRGPAAYQ